MFFCIVISKGNLPSSSLQAILLAVLLTPKYSLQNLRCVFSMSVLSHLLKSFFSYAPQTSELYRRMGEIIVSKIFVATFGDSLWRSICFLIL